jgi:magnesium chelatase subunit D
MILIRDEDMRFKQREKRMGHLVIFVVDGSGSMGAQRRMIETKGAVQSLLMDCYQKRDRISMIVFRKDRAEVVLSPTASIKAASRQLKEIPVGGKTPLSAGLLEAFRLVQRVRPKSAETRFLIVLVTDGRANQGLSEMPIKEEIFKMTSLLSEQRFTDFIVIDTEDKGKFIRTDLAREVASTLGANYYEIEDLKAGHLTEIVRERKSLAI